MIKTFDRDGEETTEIGSFANWAEWQNFCEVGRMINIPITTPRFVGYAALSNGAIPKICWYAQDVP